MPVFGTMASRFNDDGVTALYQALAAQAGRARSGHRRGQVAAGRNAPQHAPGGDRARRAGALSRRHRRHGARLQAAGPGAGPAGARGATAARDRPHAARRRRDARRREEHRAQAGRRARGAARCLREEAPRDVARDAQGLRRRRVRGEDPRPGDPHRPRPYDLERQQDPQGRAAAVRGPWRTAEVAAARQRARQLSLRCRHLRLQARGRGPDAHVRRRGRRLPHESALQAREPGHAGQAPEHGLRFGHAVRQRPGSAARHLRQGRQLGCQHRHARRPEGAVSAASTCATRRPRCQHDDQRPGADDPGDVHERRDRPAARQVQEPTTAATRPTPRPPRSANGRSPTCAARCRPTS